VHKEEISRSKFLKTIFRKPILVNSLKKIFVKRKLTKDEFLKEASNEPNLAEIMKWLHEKPELVDLLMKLFYDTESVEAIEFIFAEPTKDEILERASSLSNFFKKAEKLLKKWDELNTQRLVKIEESMLKESEVPQIKNRDLKRLREIVSSLSFGQVKHYGKLLDLYEEKMDYIDSGLLADELKLDRSTVRRFLGGSYRLRGSSKISEICSKKGIMPVKVEKGAKKRTHYKPIGIFEWITRYRRFLLDAAEGMKKSIALEMEAELITFEITFSSNPALYYSPLKGNLKKKAKKLASSLQAFLKDLRPITEEEIEQINKAVEEVSKIEALSMSGQKEELGRQIMQIEEHMNLLMINHCVHEMELNYIDKLTAPFLPNPSLIFKEYKKRKNVKLISFLSYLLFAEKMMRDLVERKIPQISKIIFDIRAKLATGYSTPRNLRYFLRLRKDLEKRFRDGKIEKSVYEKRTEDIVEKLTELVYR
jgi:hypothetical protein